eukprot:scaffold39496_cov256-Skeletonema_marinoi.AAC.2
MISIHCGRRTVMGAINIKGERIGPVIGGIEQTAQATQLKRKGGALIFTYENSFRKMRTVYVERKYVINYFSSNSKSRDM